MIRHEYQVGVDGYRASGRTTPAGFELRQPIAADRLELAALMMDAYGGTIDYDGETEEQAAAEVDGYLAGEAYLDTSLVAVRDGRIVSAVLVSRILGVPLIGYAMTRAEAKGQGLASALLDASAEAIWAAGHDEIRAFITAGNGPSETIFKRAGFEVIGTYGEE
jgi:RimJ/RimL family protein N-acetyltransferase